MIAVRFVGSELCEGQRVETYQGRVSLPAGPVVTRDGVELTPIRPVGYAYVMVPAKTHPDPIRAKLTNEFAAGLWFVFCAAMFGQPPTKHAVGMPLIVGDEFVPTPSTAKELAGSVAGCSDTLESGDERR